MGKEIEVTATELVGLLPDEQLPAIIAARIFQVYRANAQQRTGATLQNWIDRVLAAT